MDNCIFCNIVKNIIPVYKIWENDNFIAFLDIFPETTGMTLVIPKKHMSSDILELSDKQIHDLIDTATNVARILKNKLSEVVRVTYKIEGLDINHLHIKLIPFYLDTRAPKPNIAKDSELNKLHRLITT